MDAPEQTQDILIAPRVRERVDAALGAGALAGGWLLTGPRSVGKATLAFAVARAFLSKAERLGEADETTARLVAQRSHPDLVILERRENERTGRLKTEIAVDDVRAATARLSTKASSGRRVVVVDTADELGRAGANALLKSLEEPPAGTAFLLLSRTPGRLLPTIRSRCRLLPLPPLHEDALAGWLSGKTGIGEAEGRDAARLSAGAPGRALSLLDGEGEAARELAERFAAAVAGQGDLLAVAEAAGAKANDAAWPEARQIVLDRIGGALRGQSDPVFSNAAGPALLEALDEARALSARSEALNGDRTQTALVLGRLLAKGMRRTDAGR